MLQFSALSEPKQLSHVERSEQLYFSTKLVDCKWRSWDVGPCSKSCEGGQRNKTRVKLVEAGFGGKECLGNSSMLESCNAHECPGIGGWFQGEI